MTDAEIRTRAIRRLVWLSRISLTLSFASVAFALWAKFGG